MVITIGVLELQGGYGLHHNLLKKIGISSKAVKIKADFSHIDGLIIPGGESTTLSLLIEKYKLKDLILEFAESNPILGTCAGLIIMSKKNYDDRVDELGLLDIEIKRNAFGRQIMSNREKIIINIDKEKNMELISTFIRAPKIKSYGSGINIIGEHKGEPVAVFSRNCLGLCFHPEIDEIDIFHKMMFDKTSQYYFKNIKQKDAA